MEHSLSSAAELVGLLGEADVYCYEELLKTYPLAVTPYYLSLVENHGDRKDPIGRQCLPDLAELSECTSYLSDPLQEERHMPLPGLVHRYHDRCLVLVTRRCAVHCRHCNRRRLWGGRPLVVDKKLMEGWVDYIGRRKQLREVILSGGDPLTLEDDRLDWLLGSLRTIDHVEVLRIGSRIPVVMPMRITEGLCAILKKYRPLWLNTQFNHPRELTKDAVTACEMLLTAGIPVSNQSVLLKGVNDDFETMRDLVHGLHRASVRPYYLFQADRVKGTAHFHVSPEVGRGIIKGLWQTTTGLCIPRYVIDKPGKEGKLTIV